MDNSQAQIELRPAKQVSVSGGVVPNFNNDASTDAGNGTVECCCCCCCCNERKDGMSALECNLNEIFFPLYSNHAADDDAEFQGYIKSPGSISHLVKLLFSGPCFRSPVSHFLSNTSNPSALAYPVYHHACFKRIHNSPSLKQ